MKIHPVVAELLHADGRTDGRTNRHEANSRSSQLCERVYMFVCGCFSTSAYTSRRTQSLS
jgi:hypothetical protein